MKILCTAALLVSVSSAAVADDTVVTIEKFAFAPNEVTVAPGTKVIWRNKDETPHAISAKDNGFKSKAIDTDETYEYTFANPGDFSYFCTLHPFMIGVVHVRAGGKGS